jgi:uncharacterized membrane protein
MTLYVFSVWLHIIAACVWIGSSVFLVVVVLPFFRSRPDQLFIEFIVWSAPRLRAVGWGSLGVLAASGIVNLYARGIGVATLLDGTFWRSPLGRTLGEKLAVVAVIVVVTAFHDFYWGPRTLALRRLDPGSMAAQRARKVTMRLGQVSLVLSLVAVFLAVMLVRGRL